MKRLAFLIAFLLIVGMAAFSADVETLSVSGSVGMSFGDEELNDGVGPGFDPSISGAFATIGVGTANDKVEAGVTVSLVPSIEVTQGNTADTPDLEQYGYGYFDAISNLVTFYENAIQGVTFTDDDGNEFTFDPIDFNALEDQVEASTGLDFMIYGNPTDGWTVEDDSDVIETWTEAHRDHGTALYSTIRDAIYAQILSISDIYDANMAANAGWWLTFSQTVVYASWTDDEKAAAQDEQDLMNDFNEYMWGTAEDTTASASTPVTSAYLRLNAIGGILDIEFEVNGKAVSVGSMVTSENSSGDANYGLTLGLDEAVVPGLAVSVLVTTYQDASVSDDVLTYEDETDADPAVTGAQLNAGYTFSNDMMSAGLSAQFGIVDFNDATAPIIMSFMPMFSMPGVAGLSVGAELDILILDGVTGIGIGAKVGASIMGISPSLAFYNKNDDFGNDGSEDFFGNADVDDSSMMSQFNTTRMGATGLAFDISVDFAELIGMKLLTLGYGLDLYIDADYTNMGMDGSIGADFSEVLGVPLTAGFSIGRYIDNDLTWKGTIGYTYAELFMASFALEQTETDVIGYSLSGTVSF